MDEQLRSQKEVAAKFTLPALRRRQEGKGSQTLIVKFSEFLPARDRALLRAVYAEGRSGSEMARLKGARPRAVNYRVQQLAARVLDPAFAFVAAHRHAWGRTRAKVATACFLHGRSIREAARLARVTFHTARQHHAAVLALMDAAPAPAPNTAISTARDVLGGAA